MSTHPRDDAASDERTTEPEQLGRHWSAASAPPEGRRWGLIIAAMLLAVVVGIGGLSIFKLQQNLVTSPLNLGQEEAEDSGATDILILGSDTRAGEGNSATGGRGGQRRRQDGRHDAGPHLGGPRGRHGRVLPRDLMVEIPECTDPETGQTYPAQDAAMLNSAGRTAAPAARWQRSMSSPA